MITLLIVGLLAVAVVVGLAWLSERDSDPAPPIDHDDAEALARALAPFNPHFIRRRRRCR